MAYDVHAASRTGLSICSAVQQNLMGIWMLVLFLKVASEASSQAVQVATPAEFQEQVRMGTPHTIITEHLDMSGLPRFSEGTIEDTTVISILSADTSTTRTIRVRPARRCIHLYTGRRHCMQALAVLRRQAGAVVRSLGHSWYVQSRFASSALLAFTGTDFYLEFS